MKKNKNSYPNYFVIHPILRKIAINYRFKKKLSKFLNNYFV